MIKRFQRLVYGEHPQRGGGGSGGSGGSGGGPPSVTSRGKSKTKTESSLPGEFQEVMDVFNFQTPGDFLPGSTQTLEDTISSYEELTPRLQGVQKDLLLGNLARDGILGTALLGGSGVPGLYGGGQSGNGYMGDIAPALGEISRSIDPASDELSRLLMGGAKTKAGNADQSAAVARSIGNTTTQLAQDNASLLDASALGMLGLGEEAMGLAEGGMATAAGQQDMLAGAGDQFLAAGMAQMAETPAEILLRDRGVDFASSKGKLTPLQQRNLEQATRAGQVARGRSMGQSAAFEEAGARLSQELNKEARDIALGTDLLGAADQLTNSRFNRATGLAGMGGNMMGQSQGILGSAITNAGASTAPASQGANLMAQNQGILSGSLQPYTSALAMEATGQDLLNQAFGANMAVSGRPGGMNAMNVGMNFAGSQSSPALVDPLTPLNLAADTASAYAAFNAAEGGALASMLGAEMQADAARSAGQSNMMGNIIGGGLTGLGMFLGSDRRLKKDITRVGTTPAGIPTYRFRYNGGDQFHIGVMADEVIDIIPEAVGIRDQYLVVDYSRIR